MRNLFLLLWKNNFTLLFVLLQLFSLYLVVQNNRFQQVSAFNSTNVIVGSFMEGFSYMTEYASLKENNKNLAKENANLKSKLPESYYENYAVRNIVNDSTRSQEYSYIPARIINNSINKRNNYLTLDKGSNHGIKPEMGVISSNGVVGIVENVSDHFSTVRSVLHKHTSISARFSNNNYKGSLKWNGNDYSEAQLYEIPVHVKFKKGDTIVTTRFSSSYPENIMIGLVNSSITDKGGNFQILNLKLTTNFANLSYVYIVDYLFKTEQQQLELEAIINNDN